MMMLESLINCDVMIFCANYIYAGKLVSVVDESLLKLENPHIVYETGPFDNPAYKDCQKLTSNEWIVNLANVESIGIGKALNEKIQVID